VEERDDLALQKRAEVNEDIAAGDQIEVPKGRINQDVLPREDTHVPNGFVDLNNCALPGEKTAQALVRNVLGDVLGINAATRPLDALLADVRGEKLETVRADFRARSPAEAAVLMITQNPVRLDPLSFSLHLSSFILHP
jgi:hypothetical protein